MNNDVSALYPPLSSPKSRKSPSPGGSQLDILDPNLPAPSLSSSIIMHNDGPGEEKPGINSLELLQKRAQGILNNASQGKGTERYGLLPILAASSTVILQGDFFPLGLP